MKKLNILISCYACSPYRGSEPGMGWKFIKELSKYHKLWVITEKDNFENDIIKGIKDTPEFSKNVKFFFIKKKRHKLLRKIWPPSYYWFYKSWQKKAYIKAKELNNSVNFDLAHQLNMAGYREPGYLWKLDIPFVWGPMGGLENTPWHLLTAMNFKGIIFYTFRNIINTMQMHLSVRPRGAAKKAGNGLLPATINNQKLAEKIWNVKGTIMCEVGPPEGLQNILPEKRDKGEALKIVWTGQHTPGKALNILLYSLAKLPKTINWHLDILGIGECSNQWRKLSRHLGIDDNCIWHGWLKLDEAQQVMKTGHLLVITSLKDLTSTVLLEGLAYGLPVICLDHCGFSNIVNESCGIKIPIKSFSVTVNDIAFNIQKIYSDEELRYQLAFNAIERAKEFDWQRKILLLNKVYQEKITIYENSTCSQ